LERIRCVIEVREGESSVSFSEAVAQGLAPDGGLYLPEEFPDLSSDLEAWADLDYPSLCTEFFRHFATDLSTDDLESCVRSAYAKFSNKHTAPYMNYQSIGNAWSYFMVQH
jgi:threonine synthase